MEDKKVRSITLTITHSCNLNCSYCYEKHKNSKRMTFDTAINIVEKELNDESNLKEIQLNENFEINNVELMIDSSSDIEYCGIVILYDDMSYIGIIFVLGAELV